MQWVKQLALWWFVFNLWVETWASRLMWPSRVKMELLEVETIQYTIQSLSWSSTICKNLHEVYRQTKVMRTTWLSGSSLKSHDIWCVSHPAPSDYTAVAVTLMFPSGSSSTPTPSQQCTSIVITNDNTPEDQDKSFTLLASSSNPGVFFTPGRNTASVVIHHDDSKL